MSLKGSILVGDGKYEEAITWLDKALEIDPGDVTTLQMKGIALYNLGNYEEAIISVNKMLEIKPNDDLVHDMKQKILSTD